MKFFKQLINRLLVCGFVLALVSSARAEDNYNSAKVVRIKGDARYTSDNTTWHPVQLNMIIKPGTVIQTGEGSSVDIVLGDGQVDPSPQPVAVTFANNPLVEQNLIRLWENTTMAIDKLIQTSTGADTMTETQLDLRAGRIFGTVKKLSATSIYEIKIPNGVAGVRGTIYMVSADGVVAVLQGAVMVSYMGADGTVITKEIGQGYEFDTRTGEIKPLADLRHGQLIRLAWESRIFINRKYQFMHDHTIYWVSPIK